MLKLAYVPGTMNKKILFYPEISHNGEDRQKKDINRVTL
jgi:hypothetical protein